MFSFRDLKNVRMFARKVSIRMIWQFQYFLWLMRINIVHFLVKNGPIFLIFVLFALFLPKYQKRFKTSLIFACFDWFWAFRNFTYRSDFETSKTNYSWWSLFPTKILKFLKSLHENEQEELFLSISIIFDACYFIT